MKRKSKSSALDMFINFFIFIVFVFCLGYILFTYTSLKNYFQDFNKNYTFISPVFNNKKIKINQTIRPFYKSEIESLISGSFLNSGIENISFYFRDLNNGYVFGINERELFSPASLTKVPTMMLVLKQVQEAKFSLDKKVLVKGLDKQFNIYYEPFLSIKNNSEYSIKELLEYMIRYSDNGATFALWQFLSGQNLKYQDVYRDLKIEFSGDYVEVIDYSYLFRVLFTASYLNKYYSEYALNLLSQSVFDKGLTKYFQLEGDILVAHKFGEFIYNGTIRQLHDCGIIYRSDRAYVLCIMTRGRVAYVELENIIGNISKNVFELVFSKK